MNMSAVRWVVRGSVCLAVVLAGGSGTANASPSASESQAGPVLSAPVKCGTVDSPTGKVALVAESTMAAVLSLGAVGYGVAMMFLSFGAPDLAMTQFSVETLTVLIYAGFSVLLARNGALEPWSR